MAPTVFEGVDALRDAAGRDLGVTGWIEVDRARVDDYARATGDDSLFGAADVPEGLTLALSNLFLPQLLEVRQVSMGVNYGVDQVRFPSSLPVGSRVRARAEVIAVDEVSGGVQVVVRIELEAEQVARPACIIESISRFLA